MTRHDVMAAGPAERIMSVPTTVEVPLRMIALPRYLPISMG
jgi:hypothetical protein